MKVCSREYCKETQKGDRLEGPEGDWLDAVDRDAKRMLKWRNWKRMADDKDAWRQWNKEANAQVGL